ncbi:CaiB/BaiF CoA transferase family protein [Paraburkholderia aromaticivorans]|uniref:CaiB/BaiF CoA transferase family protein n=1 Tax=Paraburkholderia aromaticivorans TaxID=2026199 RepID=UPI001456016A|nr:CaiB/BaiF CoA-transferase family protein [Paraburkholderia aromaticivorans]
MSGKPLDGLRILEVGAYISAPYAGMLLSALGAEVVKIEPLEGEAFRRGIGNASHYFVQYNAGKKSVAVDLKSRDGVNLVKALVPRFDVLTENMRPGKMDKLGLGADVCREINPRLVYMSVSGFGSGGPLMDRPAYDTIGQSYGGFYHMMNDVGDARLSGTCLADLITGVSATMGILAALVGRARSSNDTGARVETSLLEAISMLTIDAVTQRGETAQDPTRESRHPQAQNFCLNTASGGAIALHLSGSEKFWGALTRAIERPDLLDDPRFRRYPDRAVSAHYHALVEILEAEFCRRSRDEWEQRLTAADVPYAPVLSLGELAVHPQVEWLQLLGTAPSGQTLVRPPWRFDGERPNRNEPTAHVGEHTRQVLGEILSEAQVNELIANGTVVTGE